MKKGIFYFLCFITFFLFINSCFHIRNYKSYVIPPYNTMNVIVDGEFNNREDVILKENENFSEIPKSGKILNKQLNNKIKTLDILVKKGLENKINRVIIFNDLKIHYFKNLSELKNEEMELCPNKHCSKYIKYEIPNSIKHNKNSDSLNYRNNINSFTSSILSIVSGGIEFFIPLVLLFITIIFYIKNEIKFNFKGEILTAIIFISGILIYSNCIFDYLPWTDEYATIEYSNPDKPFLNTFSDPGNPPIFYILFRIFISIFGISTVSMKIFPFLIGILFLISIFIFLKKNFDLKTANIGLFLSVINIPLIYYAQETRSYIFQAFLSVFLTYSLFNILIKNRNKDYIFYGILAIIASNVHYFEILLLVGNFIFASIYFLIEKRYKDILKFFLSNLMALIAFLPFFIFTSLNKALMNSDFNAWIPDISYLQIKKCVYYITGGFIPLILSIVFFVRQFFKKEKNLREIGIIYTFFSTFFVIFLGVILSYLIRPMLVERYLVLICPIYITFLALVFSSKYKNRFIVILFIIWTIFMQNGLFEKNNRRKGIIEEPMAFSKLYFENERPKNQVYSIINFSYPEYLDNKDEYMINEIKYLSSSKFNIKENIENILKEDKNAIIFTSLLEATEENSKLGENYICYFNSSTDTCLWKIKKDKND